MKNIQISYYNGAKDNTGTVISLLEALEIIGSDDLSEKVHAIANATDDTKRTSLKSKLPAVTWSGKFTKRKASALEIYSYVICFDFDKLTPAQLTAAREKLRTDNHILAYFYSPSGKGLKVLIKVTSGPENHKAAFLQLAEYFKTGYNLTADESGKDVCRLCFLSWDNGIYVNEKSAPVEIKLPTAPVAATVIDTPLSERFEVLREFTSRKIAYVENSYNAHLSTFAINCKENAISREDTFNYCQTQFADYVEHHPAKALDNIINSVYDNHRYIFGKYPNLPNLTAGSTQRPLRIAKTQTAVRTPGAAATVTPAPGTPAEFNEDQLFWYEVTLDKKDKDGNALIDYKFSYDDCIEFLQNNGFYRYPIENGKYQLIRITDKIVETVERVQIKDFILSYLKSVPDSWEYKKVREMFRRGCKTFLSSETLEGLEYRKPVFERDTETTKFFYFKQYYLSVTKDTITHHKLEELQNHIWKKQIINFDLDFNPAAGADDTCVFQQFLQLAILERAGDTGFTDVDKKKMLSVYTAIGYMLHMYKHPDLTKAVVAVDKQLRKLGEANGRSGKSLLGKALKHMMPTTLIDAKNFKWDYEFSFQKVDIDTRLINFNDVTKAFDFERLFGMITEEFDWQKKGQQMFTLPFEDSPKFYISTNYSLKGDGDSNKGRQHIIEFSNYFNAQRTPFTEFKNRFFTNWDAAQWNAFYLFMINCVKLYLKNSLVDFPLENYELNQFFDTWSEDALDWCDTIIRDQIQHQPDGLRLDKDKLFKEFITEFKSWDKIKKNRFSKQLIERYCTIRGIAINAHLKGERDRSNGADYLTFTIITKEV